MKEIYNEGRVIGLSAYEAYVRQLLSTHPDATPMTEREWLSAMLAESSSMILRIPAGTTAGYHDYPLPEGSQLCAATIIYASLFRGKIKVDQTGYWATFVTDYGPLFSNTHLKPPVTPGFPEDIPVQDNLDPMPEAYRIACKEYIKVVNGLVIQPGTWTDNTYYTPLLQEQSVPLVNQDDEEILVPVNEKGIERSIDPDFSHQPFVRLLIAEDITADILIFLHGFVNSVPYKGESSMLVADPSDRPQDGDFLGPNIFPWGCPIVLTTTTDIQYAIQQDITRLENRINGTPQPRW